MSKPALSKAIRDAAGVSVTQADAAVEAVLATIVDAMKTDGRFAIFGFGTFSKTERAARTGRNPKTGESIKIAASRGVKFSAAAALKKTL